MKVWKTALIYYLFYLYLFEIVQQAQWL